MSHKLQQIERAVFQDPSGRGLIGKGSHLRLFYEGEISKAAHEIVNSAKSIGIVTGFFVSQTVIPAAETDGPPGSVLLGKALQEIGIDVVFITDSFCNHAVRTAMRFLGFEESSLRTIGKTESRFTISQWQSYLEELRLTHLISVERVGPSYSWEDLAQLSTTFTKTKFEKVIPQANQNRCHNMYGKIIDDESMPLHRLFEVTKIVNPQVKTISIGDGGNEIGMGKIPFEELAKCLKVFDKEFIACRIATDWNIVAGTSNWGAMALAASILTIANKTQLMNKWDWKHHRSLIETMVVDGPAVDGVTGRQDVSVDGLPFETYYQPWQRIREILDLNDKHFED